MSRARAPVRADHAGIAQQLAACRAFIEDDVIIDLAAADERGIPTIAIGLGCSVSLSPPQLSVYVAGEQSADFLAAVAATRRVAVVIGHAPAHEALQFKGNDCRIDATTKAERRVADAYRDTLVRQLRELGFTPAQTAVYGGFPVTDLVALRFTPTSIFQQTPGPQAGEPL